MCAQFLIKANLDALSRRFKIKKVQDNLAYEERIVPYRRGPVLIQTKDGTELHMMNFSLIPSWSKEPKMKFSTYNARLDTVTEKPTWKKPFSEKRCLIPMTDFIEPIYTGQFAGHMVGFKEKSEKILAAAGIWSEWVNPKTGEVLESFAILTHHPNEFVKRIGHDRMPIFLKEEFFEKWTDPSKKDPEELKNLLNEATEAENFDATSDRPLKAGWEKRK